MEPKSIHEEFHFNSDRGVNNSLERHERAFLEKCRLWNLKLNRDKVKRNQSSVKFMGHLGKGLTLRRSWPYYRCLNLRTSLHWSDSLGWWPILQSLCITYQRWQSHSDALMTRMWSSNGFYNTPSQLTQLDQEVSDGGTCSSLLRWKQASHCPTWWLRSCIAAKWPACSKLL